MTTITIEPSTVSDLARSLQVEFKKVDLLDVKVHAINPTRVRTETPVQRLADCHFVADAEHCSWTTAKGKIILQLKTFAVEQRVKNHLLYMDLIEGTVIHSLLSDLLHGTHTGVRDIFITRSLRAIEGLKSLDEANLRETVKAPSDYSVLVSALSSEPALTAVRDTDPLIL